MRLFDGRYVAGHPVPEGGSAAGVCPARHNIPLSYFHPEYRMTPTTMVTIFLPAFSTA